MKRDSWKTSRRPGAWYVEVQFQSVYGGELFFSMVSGFTTKREAIADAAERTASGKICRITNANREVVTAK